MADQILQEIKDRLNIADVIGGYITLKKAGVNFKAPCPFHHEKTPSLIVSPQKQIWHCFGCGEGGDVFGFVIKYENLEFRDALKLLADKAGVKLPSYRPENKHEQDEKDLLLRINSFAAAFYHKVLNSQQGERAYVYLINRGLTKGTIERWQIGFAPDDFHSLERALLVKKVNQADMIKAGVSAKNERGQVYDRFRGRITFPIFNYFGEVVGFSARILTDDGKSAKYVNSPETPIYNKSRTLFGLNFAKDSIRKKDEAVLVEGQMDCIAAHQAGFENTVAVSGTALTEVGLAQLGRLTKNLKFCFDADQAGKTASRRAGEMALPQGFKLKVIKLQAAKDPDELIKKSPGLWERAVKEAVWFLDYYIDLAQTSFAPDSVEQKHFLSAQVLPFLGFIQDPLEQDHYIRKMSTKFSISEKIIRDNIKKSVGKQISESAVNSPLTHNGLLLQKEVLGGLLFSNDFILEAKSQLEMNDFEDPEIRQIVELILHRSGSTNEVNVATLAKEASFMVESQLEELEGDTEKLKKSLLKSLALLKVNSFKRQQISLQNQVKTAELAKDKAKVEKLSREFAEISKARLEFEKQI